MPGPTRILLIGPLAPAGSWITVCLRFTDWFTSQLDNFWFVVDVTYRSQERSVEVPPPKPYQVLKKLTVRGFQ